MLKHMRDRKRSLKAVRKNITRLLWQAQSLSGPFYILKGPSREG